MNYQATIDDLTKRIDKMSAARAALREIAGSASPVKRSTLSAAGRASIKAAQRKRWAEQKRKRRAAAKKKPL